MPIDHPTPPADVIEAHNACEAAYDLLKQRGVTVIKLVARTRSGETFTCNGTAEHEPHNGPNRRDQEKAKPAE